MAALPVSRSDRPYPKKEGEDPKKRGRDERDERVGRAFKSSREEAPRPINKDVVHLARGGNPQEAERLFHAMRRDNVQPRPETVHALIRAYIDRGDIGRAELFLDGMVLERFVFAPQTLDDLLKASAERFNIAQAKALFNKIRPCYRELSQPLWILVEACIGKSDIPNAVSFFQEMIKEKSKVDAIHFNRLLHACVKNRRSKEAWTLYRQMVDQQISPSVVTLTTLINVCAETGEIDKAQQLLEEMIQRKFPLDPVVFGSMMKVYIKTKDLEGAERLLKRMDEERVKPNQATFSALIDVAIAANNIEKAKRYFQENFRDLRKGGPIDLHGLSTGVAKTAILLFVEDRDQQSLTLITGRERKPSDPPGEGVIRQVVRTFVGEHPEFEVEVKEDRTNPGRLLLEKRGRPREQLRALKP